MLLYSGHEEENAAHIQRFALMLIREARNALIGPQSDGKHGIQWIARNQLEDLDFADDLALLSHTYQQIQVNAINSAEFSASVGKTTILQYNIENTNQITLDGEAME
ncbi:unnamed protein product [Schistosoma margrebowiei]|uniref:Uncharacterized protein n=1 Tax=Schistosoma margrebowiei TaxID=48269 RepID=A0A183LBM2_9TREM|nr:unnamed protein product [Schistosoma margrebowiei]